MSREIDSIRQSNIFLCRPKLYEDEGDCKCIDDVEALVKYTVTERSRDKYKKVRKLFTSEFYDKIVKEVKENMDIAQGKLVMGYRCNVDYLDEEKYYSLLLGSRILGGGADSKLFINAILAFEISLSVISPSFSF